MVSQITAYTKTPGEERKGKRGGKGRSEKSSKEINSSAQKSKFK